ncbi:MAG: tRNA-dihydrouridine synthase [Candidatus Pacebacteria bacterium]|jgi:nifR3 family TIM-barrel protein|nr:tRNA-dihydrouridine synthase [Parcubacteria group bacterium]MDP6249256.1 tRNA-dihydrouridine synthase [Candidatus Paceibacterota bacterium]MDP7159064.1 tRNA-dihydrouridine synthase [Candidatus Paceibacterota bacterium]MDP7366604.1 tRNA-dihydrouridine synthase [Candidatus Paceibacterota bacterium]MDP7466114.1 tRNA-dihydrouridine synthase [Candidatus Paceibacterota bacterium]|tara:strand:- start:31646 stop:32596 length:951 start_codon:yes stop_codon:yes gene_type:complete
MSKNFWQKLNKPIFLLAPMADVTDAPFRRIIAKYGKPDVMYTEFVSADGLFLGGKDALIKDLAFTNEERPIVAQFFTSKPELMKKAAELARELGFDGIDINMGCPDRSIEKQGAGANLMKNPELASELINSAKEGAGELPVSVKTRVGYSKYELDKWLPTLLSAKPSAIIIHARTRKQLSKVSADWSFVKKAVEIRDKVNPNVLIIGNGDVTDIKDAREKASETGADGVMLGRAIFGNPWLFDENKDSVSKEMKLKVLVEHTKLFEEIAPHKNFLIMKKHYKAYVNGWDGAKELRIKLMQAGSASEVEEIIKIANL